MKTGEWNHRVLKRMGKNGEMSFAIHEIFYDDAGDISFAIDHPCILSASSLDELQEHLDQAKSSLAMPALDHDTVLECVDNYQKKDDEELAEELLEMKKQIDYRYGFRKHSVDFLPRITLSVLVDDAVEGVIGKTVSLNVSWITLYFSMDFTEYSRG